VLFVVGLGMLREWLADHKRKKEDTKANKTLATRIQKGGKKEQVPSMKLEVGDIIEIQDEETIPADCFVLQTTAFDNG
jgi:P-type E1-E2 ATPase